MVSEIRIQQQSRVKRARYFLGLYGSDPNSVLETVVTDDGSLLRTSIEPRKFIVCQLTKKLMATIFWDCEDFKEIDTTFNGMYYSALLFLQLSGLAEIRYIKCASS